MFHADVQSGLRLGRGDWVRLRTLILLRWMAIAGQIAALLAARYFQLRLPVGRCSIAIGASVIANLAFRFVYPATKRLSGAEATRMPLFDLCQLVFLLAVTGGLTNPFAVLVLAPVTISASALDLRPALVIAVSAIVLVTLTAFVNIPLTLTDGTILQVPMLFRFGFWLALVIGIGFLGNYSRRVATEIRAMSDAVFTAQMALAREQQRSDLGGAAEPFLSPKERPQRCGAVVAVTWPIAALLAPPAPMQAGNPPHQP